MEILILISFKGVLYLEDDINVGVYYAQPLSVSDNDIDNNKVCK